MSGVSRDSWRGRQHWRNRIAGSQKQAEAGRRHGFRSGLESDNAQLLEQMGVPVLFEHLKLAYVVPETKRHYTPDFQLPNFIIIETKGKFELSDRAKHLLVKSQYPEMDLRFVFSRPHDPIYKGSRTTYAAWCDKYGFKYAAKRIPKAWVEEASRGEASLKRSGASGGHAGSDGQEHEGDQDGSASG